VQLVAPDVVQVLFPGVEVTVYRVIAAPPSESGASQVTVDTVESNDVPATPVGAPGTVDGVARFEGSEASLVPARFVAVTVNR
jgi:hypothetical protein